MAQPVVQVRQRDRGNYLAGANLWRIFCGETVPGGRGRGELSREDLEMLALVWFERLGYDHQRQLFDVYAWEKEKTKTSYGTESVDYRKLGEAHIKAMGLANPNPFLMVAALVPDVYCAGYSPGAALSDDSKLALTAPRYGVDAAKITAEVRAELSSKKHKKHGKGDRPAGDTQ